MIPKEILPFYTHLAVDPDASELYANLSTFYRDEGEAKEFKYNTNQQGYSLLYRVGAGSQETVEVFPPYRYTYGINRLQGSVSTNYDFNYPAQSDPVYSQATVGFADPVTAPESILTRACGVAGSVSVTGLGAETLYIGNFINESREIIYTSNPINLNIEGLLFLYVVRSRAGVPYQPGIDYIFDPVYQSITFNESITIDLYTPIVVEVGVATLDGDYKVITTNGTHSLPAAFSYGVAVTGPEGINSIFSAQITWTSVIDDSAPNANYVLALSDETGCKTLASSGSNNITITDVNALIHRTTFRDFTDVIRASTPVPVESETNLSGTVAYSEVKVESASVPGYNERRLVTFDLTGDNPVEVVSLETEAYCRSGAFDSGLNRTGAIRSLPQALGVSEIEDSVLDNNRVPVTITPTFKVLIPANNSGLLGKYDLTADMDLMNPISAAWGLLLAASYNDSDLILLNLKALVYQAKQRGWIKLEDGVYVIDTTISAGLPIYFSATNPDYVESFKEVGSNAFLGWAACLSILSLTDDQLRTYYAMQGSANAFQTELLLTLEAMALFVANGVSRVTWFAAYKEDAGGYSYDQSSLTATVYADMFLSYLLAIRYNSTAHYVAAKLRESLVVLPADLSSEYFTQFYERDYDAVQYPFDPILATPEEIAEHNKTKRFNALFSYSRLVGGPRFYIDSYFDPVVDQSDVNSDNPPTFVFGQNFNLSFNTSESNTSYTYAITGVNSSDINGAPLTGTWSPGQVLNFTATPSTNSNFIFTLTNSLGNVVTTTTIPLVILQTGLSAWPPIVTQGDTFSVTFSTNLSGAYPYIITGVNSADIGNAQLSGTFTSSQVITFTATQKVDRMLTLSLADGTRSVDVGLNYVKPPIVTTYNDPLSTPWSTIEAKTDGIYEGATYDFAIVGGTWHPTLTYGLLGTSAYIEWGRGWSYTPTAADSVIQINFSVFMSYVFNTDGGGNFGQGAKFFPVTLVVTQGLTVFTGVNSTVALKTGAHLGYSKTVSGGLIISNFTPGVPITINIAREQAAGSIGAEKVTTIAMSNLNVVVTESFPDEFNPQ